MTPYTSDRYQPAETTSHKCTLMAYPNDTCVTGGELLLAVQKEVVSIANTVAEFEPVTSYVNFQPVNGGLVISKFGHDERDAEALSLFQTLYPDRKVV